MNDENKELLERRLSERLVNFVELFFAVALGASILRFNGILFPPDVGSVNFWALTTVYLTAITSWIGWHKSTQKYPYTDSKVGRLRALTDGAVVITYIGLLFFGSRADGSLWGYLWGFVMIFALYLASGVLRRIEHGTAEASRISMIGRYGLMMVAVAVAYTIWREAYAPVTDAGVWTFVFLPLLVVLTYRYMREWRELQWSRAEGNIFYKQRERLAIDMDGVLAEQVIPVLEKLKRESGLELNKNDITSWDYAFADTNIKSEIEKAERKREFVLELQPVMGALEALRLISKKYDITIATSRQEMTDKWTCEWLNHQGIQYDRIVNTRKFGKVLPKADILVDDYIGNINAFLRRGRADREAILFAQPWNCNTKEIADLIESRRVMVANSWDTILAMLGCENLENEESVSHRKVEAYESQNDVQMDYVMAQAITSFAASLLFLYGYSISSSPWQLGIAVLFLITALVGSLAYAWSWTSWTRRAWAWAVNRVACIAKLDNCAKRWMRIMWFAIAIAALAGVMMGWAEGISLLEEGHGYFKTFLVGGLIFVIIYTLNFLRSCYLHKSSR